jgi:hypothetical protein
MPWSGLTAWYVRRETRTITYPAKGGTRHVQAPRKASAEVPNLSKGEMCSNYSLSICPRFLQPFTVLPEGQAPKALRSQISNSGTPRGPIIDIFNFSGGRCRTLPSAPPPPRVQASSQDNGSHLPAGGSSGAATCPRGSGSRLLARGSSGATTCPRDSGSRLSAQGSSRAATCHLGSSTHHLAHGSSGAATCPEYGFYRLQANKQISLGDPAIMISIGVHVHVSSKTLRDKGCPARSQGVQQATH